MYNRVALRKGKPTVTSQAASFAVSALWHVRALPRCRGCCRCRAAAHAPRRQGVHVGYYTFFLTGVLYLELAKGAWAFP